MVIADYNGGQKYQDIPFNEKWYLMLKIKYHWIYEWYEINAVIIGHEKVLFAHNILCHQKKITASQNLLKK